MKNLYFHPAMIFQCSLLAIMLFLYITSTLWYLNIAHIVLISFQIRNCVGTYRIIRNRDKENEKWTGMENYKNLEESE